MVGIMLHITTMFHVSYIGVVLPNPVSSELKEVYPELVRNLAGRLVLLVVVAILLAAAAQVRGSAPRPLGGGGGARRGEHHHGHAASELRVGEAGGRGYHRRGVAECDW